MPGKSLLKTGVQVSVSLLLLWWLSHQLQWVKLWQYTRGLAWWTLPLCMGVYVLAQWLSTWRWLVFLNQLNVPVKQPQLFQWYMVGMLYNQFLPGTIGGDGYRVWQVSKIKTPCNMGVSKLTAVLGVLAERGSGLAVIIWMTLVLGLFLPASPYQFIIQLLAVFTLVGYALIRFYPVSRLPARLNGLATSIRQLICPPRALIISLLLSMVIQGLMVTIHRLIAPDIPWIVLGWTYGCVTLLTMIPISFNGIGLREVGYTSLLAKYCPPEVAVSVSVLWFAIGLLTSALGLPALWFKKTNT